MTSRAKAKSAIAWSGVDLVLRHGLHFAVSIVLARLLSPEEFGTVALLYLFTGLAGAFIDSGFAAALVQRQDITHDDESTVFWFNVAIGGLFAVGLALSARIIADFFASEILVPLTQVMAINVFVAALGTIHFTLFTKKLDFRTQAKIGVVAGAISGVVAVMLAWTGWGVWALAAQAVSATAISTLLLWTLSPWRPARVFSTHSIRRLFGFGGYMLATGLLEVIFNRMYTVLIGKLYGPHELGLYARAEGTKQMPIGLLTGILARVAFPIFSAAASDKAKLKRGAKLGVRGMMLIAAPMMLGLAALAEPLVLTLFGTKWLPSVPVLQVLCLGALFWPLYAVNFDVLMAQGHSQEIFRLEVVKKIAGFALLAVGAWFGIMGLAWSQVVFGMINFLVNAHYSSKYLDYGILEQSRDFLPMILIALPMAVLISWLNNSLPLSPPIALIVYSSMGAALYFLLAWACRLDSLRDAIKMSRS